MVNLYPKYIASGDGGTKEEDSAESQPTTTQPQSLKCDE